MALVDIWDGVARQAALVTGIKAAYGSGAGSQGISVGPENPQDGPVAIVDYEGVVINHGSGSTESVAHEFAIVIWTPMGNGTRPAAVKTLAPMFDRFHVAFDANVGLFGILGTAGQCLVTGAGPLEDQTVDTGEFLTQVITVQVTLFTAITHAIGPSS